MDKAFDLLEKLAAKLGQTAEALWPHAARYQALVAMVYIIIWTLIAAILWSDYWKFSDQPWTFAAASGRPEHSRYPSAKLFLIIAAPAALFVAALVWLFNLAVALEPVGYTVMKILGK